MTVTMWIAAPQRPASPQVRSILRALRRGARTYAAPLRMHCLATSGGTRLLGPGPAALHAGLTNPVRSTAPADQPPAARADGTPPAWSRAPAPACTSSPNPAGPGTAKACPAARDPR